MGSCRYRVLHRILRRRGTPGDPRHSLVAATFFSAERTVVSPVAPRAHPLATSCHLRDIFMSSRYPGAMPNRTTFRIDEEILAEAKALAARQHRSLNSVMEEALRRWLAVARN